MRDGVVVIAVGLCLAASSACAGDGSDTEAGGRDDAVGAYSAYVELVEAGDLEGANDVRCDEEKLPSSNESALAAAPEVEVESVQVLSSSEGEATLGVTASGASSEIQVEMRRIDGSWEVCGQSTAASERVLDELRRDVTAPLATLEFDGDRSLDGLAQLLEAADEEESTFDVDYLTSLAVGSEVLVARRWSTDANSEVQAAALSFRSGRDAASFDLRYMSPAAANAVESHGAGQRGIRGIRFLTNAFTAMEFGGISKTSDLLIVRAGTTVVIVSIDSDDVDAQDRLVDQIAEVFADAAE